MTSFSECVSYSDWEGNISFFDDKNIHLALNCHKYNTDIRLTLNPVQAKILGEMLVNASLYAKPDKSTAALFGDLTMMLDINPEQLIEEDNESKGGCNMGEIEIDDETWPEVYDVITKAA